MDGSGRLHTAILRVSPTPWLRRLSAILRCGVSRSRLRSNPHTERSFPRPTRLKHSISLLQNPLDLFGDGPLDQTVGFLLGHRLRICQNLHENGGHVTVAGRHVASEGDLARSVDQDDDRIIIDTILLRSHAAGMTVDLNLVERKDERRLLGSE